MKLIPDLFIDQALSTYSEIITDTNSWFGPKGTVDGSPGPGDFDHGKMRFVNRNLNYFYYENMISHALRNTYMYNKNYTETLKFTEFLRTHLGESGPYGRMCIWRLDPECYLLPHVDNWRYHRNIRRYIFIVSEHDTNNALVKIQGQEIPIRQGLLFQFDPSIEIHEFVNKSNTNFYFLGFDYWDVKLLDLASKDTQVNKESEIEYTDGYGGFKTKCKYMSKE